MGFEEVLSTGVKYLRTDEENIYYREKDFKTQIGKKYDVNKEDLR